MDRYNHGATPLFVASATQDKEMIKLLLDKGVDVNIPEHSGITSLHNFAYKGNIDIIQMLMEKGANVNATDIHGSTPIGLAKNKSNNEAVIHALSAVGRAGGHKGEKTRRIQKKDEQENDERNI
jgi:ankyrin repeat protein